MSIPVPRGWPLAMFCVALALVIWWDMRWRRIPNWLVAALGAAGLTYATLLGGSRASLGSLLDESKLFAAPRAVILETHVGGSPPKGERRCWISMR